MLLVQVAAIHPTCTGSACRANDTGLRNDRILHRIIGLDGLNDGRCLAGHKHILGHLQRIVALDGMHGGRHAIGRRLCIVTLAAMIRCLFSPCRRLNSLNMTLGIGIGIGGRPFSAGGRCRALGDRYRFSIVTECRYFHGR